MATATYRDIFLNPKPGAYYLLTLRAAEDRGGSSKATGLILSDGIEKLQNIGRDGTIFHVRNGAIFPVAYAEVRNPKPITTFAGVEQVVKKVFDPESTGWFEDDDEEEIDTSKKHYVVVRSSDNYVTQDGSFYQQKGMKHNVRLTASWPKAMGALVGDDYSIVTVYVVEPNQTSGESEMRARLVSSTASAVGAEDTDLTIYRTGFSQYDYSINPYKGCDLGCKYCYAGVYKDYADLPQDKWQGRIVIGTHTDPYQHREESETKTQELLQNLLKHCQDKPGTITKVGIFTRSITVARDLELIKQLPNPVIHFDLSPFPDDMVAKLESRSHTNSERMKAIDRIKEAGIKLILNICPCIPGLSEDVLDTPAFHDAYAKADEICVGLLMMYGTIPQRLSNTLSQEVIQKLMSLGWENEFLEKCRSIFGRYFSEKLVIWRDRTRKGWKRMADNTLLPQEFYLE